ncbi:MAG: hypothetical protein ACK56F_20710 [bacterium]
MHSSAPGRCSFFTAGIFKPPVMEGFLAGLGCGLAEDRGDRSVGFVGIVARAIEASAVYLKACSDGHSPACCCM